MRRKMISICLALAMILSLVPANVAFAETTGGTNSTGGQLFPDVDERQVLPGETTTFGRFEIQNNSGRFDGTEEITVTLDNGYKMVKCDIYDDDGNVRSGITWGSNFLTITAPANEKYFNLQNLTIEAPADAATGSVVYATVSAAGFASGTNNIAAVVSEIDYANVDQLTLDVEPQQIEAGGTASFDVLGVDKGMLFSAKEEVTITLNEEDFYFEKDTFYDGDGTPIVLKSWSEKEIVMYAPLDPGNGFDMEELTIRADEDAKLGATVTMTASMEGYAPVTETVATVVSEVTTPDDELELDVREVQIEAGGEASFAVLGVDKEIRFKEGEKVTLTLNEGFSFVENDEFYDGDGTLIEVDSWSANEIVVLAPADPGYGFDLEELTIVADAGVALDTQATMTVSMEDHASVTKVVATVVSEITTPADELELDVREVQIIAGGEASFVVLGVDKGIRFKEGDKVTLTLNEGFSFVENDKFYDGDGTLIKVESWSANEIVVLAPANPGHGFDLEELTIVADADVALGTRAKMTASMEGYASVTEKVATVVNEITTPADELELDVRKVQIEAGGEASFAVLGVDKGIRFKEGDKVTLTLNEGFSFVENDKFYDGDGTRIKVDSWSANEIVVLAPADPGYGFDLEELTIVADADVVKGTRAKMTASMEGYAPVTEVVATVTKADLEDKTVIFELGTTEFVVNGKEISLGDAFPATTIQVDQHVMVPLRAVITILQELDPDATVSWDDNNAEATLTFDDITVQVTVDSDIAVVNGEKVQMETGCIMKQVGEGSFAYYPMKDLFEAFGAEDWEVQDNKGGFSIDVPGAASDGIIFDTDDVVDILQEELAELETLTIEINEGYLPEELELKLNRGFAFIDVSDVTGSNFTIELEDDDLAIVTVAANTSEITLSGIVIEATTAAVGDMATIAVKATGMDTAKIEVAEVKRFASGTDFEIDNVWKKGSDFDGYIDGENAPELQIAIDDITNVTYGAAQNDVEIEIQIDGAAFIDDEGEVLTNNDIVEKISLIKKNADNAVYAQRKSGGGWYFEADGEEITLESTIRVEKDSVDFTLSYAGDALQDGDVIAMDLQSVMNSVQVDDTATVSVSGDLGESIELVYCQIVDKALDVNVGKCVDILQKKLAELRTVTIETTIGYLPEELELKLNNGFTFIDVSDVTDGNFTIELEDDDLAIVTVDANTSKIKLSGIVIEATTAAVDDVAVLAVRGDGYDTVKEEVAVVIDGFVRMTVDEDEDIPEIYSGVNLDNEGITNDNRHGALQVTLKEPVSGAWDMRQPFDLTLPEGVYVTDVTVVNTNMETEQGESIEAAFEEAYADGGHKAFEFGRRIFEGSENSNKTLKLSFVLELVAVPNFEGDVTLTLSGAAMATKEVTIAKFVKPYTVNVDTLTLRQGKNGIMNDIVITEAEPGLWEEANKAHDGEYVFELYDSNEKVGFLPNNKGTVTANAESEIGVEELPNGVGFILEEESDEVAAVVTLSGYEVKTTGNSQGSFALLLKTPGSELLMEETLLSGVALGDVADAADVYDVVDEDAVIVYRKNSSSNSSSSSSSSSSSPAPTPETPPVMVDPEQDAEDRPAEEGLEGVAAEQKEELHEQVNEQLPEAEVVGEGTYTFAIADASAEETSDNTAESGTGSVKDPTKVSLDLGDQEMQDTAHLTLVKYETQPDGTVKVIKLGGSFDPETNSFSAYTDGEGVYDLVYDPEVVKMTYTIGQTEMSMNDENQESVAAPVIVDNRTMVPLRTIAENFGAEIVWDGDTQTVYIILADKVLTLEIGVEVADGQGAAMIIGDRTVVPLRYVGESFDANVRWIPSTQSIEIVK